MSSTIISTTTPTHEQLWTPPPWMPAGVTRQLTELRPSQTTLDPEINRSVDENWVAKLTQTFDPFALGLLTVWRMADQTLMILDGQHRRLACEAVGFDEPVPALVYEHLDARSAAELFLQVNAQRNVNAIDKFRKAVVAGHDTEVAVADMLDEFDLKVGHSTADVSGPGALVGAYRRLGGETTSALVRTLIEAFPEVNAATALNSDIVAPAADMLARYQRRDVELELERIRQVLVEFTYDGLLNERDVWFKGSPSHTRRWHTVAIIVKAYNGMSRSGRIPSWSDVS